MKANYKPEEVRCQIDKYLTFTLANEHYGVEILKVLEIVGMLEITPVPRTPHYVKGVANLRGKIIPVVDLRRKFDMPAGEITSQTCIIVVRAGRLEAGLLVDQVLEVTPIATDTIEEAPAFGPEVDIDFIQGLAKTERAVTILLNLDRVLEEKDFTRVREESDLEKLGWHAELAAR